MKPLEELLRELGRVVPNAVVDRPDVDPETLAEAHLGRATSQAQAYCADSWVTLFSPELLAGETDVKPSAASMAVVEGLIKPSPMAVGVKLVLSLVDDLFTVVRHTGELLAPQPLAVRGAGVAPAGASRHTFRQRLDGCRAAVGLEAEGDGRFGVTLTLEEDTHAASPLRVTLWEGARRRAIQSGEGAVHISGLRRGAYRLEVTVSGADVGTIDLDVSNEDPGD